MEFSITYAKGYCVDPAKQILAPAPSSIDAKDNFSRNNDFKHQHINATIMHE
jgi:hypothetical protein